MPRIQNVLIVAMALSAIAHPRPARAHSFLDHADPRVGSTVPHAPAAVALFFTEPVEAKFCRVTISSGPNHPIDAGPLQHPAPTQLRLVLPSLPSGEYSVHWTVTAVDSHQSEGTFTFTVAAP